MRPIWLGPTPLNFESLVRTRVGTSSYSNVPVNAELFLPAIVIVFSRGLFQSPGLIVTVELPTMRAFDGLLIVKSIRTLLDGRSFNLKPTRALSPVLSELPSSLCQLICGRTVGPNQSLNIRQKLRLPYALQLLPSPYRLFKAA